MRLNLALLGPDGLPIVAQAAKPAVWGKLVNTGGDLLLNLAAAGLILVLTIWAAGWAGKLTRKALGGFGHRHPADATLQVFMSSLARNAVYILGGIAVLSQLGVKTTSIIAAIGAASLAIGLAMQGALSNVAAGVMIFLFRPYRVGDIIESAGRTGRVRSLDLFVTELATPDNLKVVIPNAKMFGDVIINHSFHDRRRADAVFRAPLKTDIKALLDKVRERLEADPRVLKDPPPLVEVTGMNEAFVEVAVRPWAAREDYGPLKADVLLCARLLEDDPAAELPPPTKTAKRTEPLKLGAQGLI
jgi:small conductance mechanosensitive channel